jgi:fibronectin type 3 domain-containing protein
VPAPSPPPPSPTPRTVTLNWTPSTSANINGYYVYRGTVSGGPYTKLNASPIGGSSYVDNNVVSGQTYFYVATTMDWNNKESTYSNQATAVVP